MITKHDQYWHLYFNEECEDSPEAILAQVEKLFVEIAEMGDMAFLRARPEIIRENTFEGGRKAAVFCRISTPVPQAPDPSPIFFGLRVSKPE